MFAAMNMGPAFVKGLVWGAWLLYALGLRQALAANEEQAWRRTRRLWTAGGVLYLLHGILGFQFFHAWSFEDYRVTMEMQTFDAVRWRSGAPVYGNYLFTAVWAAEAAWAWIGFPGWQKRSRLVFWLIHGFLLAVFVAGMIVFAAGPVRWFSLAVLAVCLTWLGLGRNKASAVANSKSTP